MKNRRNFIKLSGLAAIGSHGISLAESRAKKTFIHGFNFKFKKGVSEEKIAKMMKELAALKEKIPVLKAVGFGHIRGARMQGLDLGVVAVC